MTKAIETAMRSCAVLVVGVATGCATPAAPRPGEVTATTRQALASSNGIGQNGLSTNGLWSNGLWSNGLWSNGLWSNGLWSNGLWSNGLVSGSGVAPIGSPAYALQSSAYARQLLQYV